MRIHRLALPLVLLLASAADAAEPEPPRAYGMIVYKEKLKVGGGCDSFGIVTQMSISMDVGGSWAASSIAGLFTGTMTPAGKPGVWNLLFDAASLDAYGAYLEEIATDLCGTPVTILDGTIEAFQLKLKPKEDTAAAAVSLRTSAIGESALGAAGGRHQLKGKGTLTYEPAIP
jgi:hypothetical protein